MADQMWNWEGVATTTVREIVRLGEAQLRDLHDASVAADQRAGTQGGILAAVGAALLAAAAALGTGEHPQLAAAFSIATAGVGLIGTALISVLAAKPTAFYAGGYEPYALMSAARDEDLMLRCVAEDLNRRIAHNRKFVSKIADRIALAYRGTLVVLTFSVGIFFGVQFIT